MKVFRVDVAVILVALATLLALVFFDARPGRGQSSVKPTVLATNSISGPPAKRNALLSTELIWTFGSKQQHGWYLYTSLVKRLLGTNRNPDSKEFAGALARWQEKTGLKPSGVLDEETLYAIVADWQGRRIKDRSPASAEALLTAPSSDFWDPERPEELRKVEREAYAAYKRMVAAAVADRSLGLAGRNGELATNEKFLKIISSFRSREYQEKLRQENPQAGSAGLAVNSPHFTGRALDLYVGGEPVSTNDANRALQVQTRVYQWLVRNAERFGFRPYFYEPWHWEYVENSRHQAVGRRSHLSSRSRTVTLPRLAPCWALIFSHSSLVIAVIG